MNLKQLNYSIFEAVSEAIQRVWSTEEKELIANDLKLQNYLKEWLNNSLSDTCWHPENYRIVRDLSALQASVNSNSQFAFSPIRN
jgi:hypothetical protein